MGQFLYCNIINLKMKYNIHNFVLLQEIQGRIKQCVKSWVVQDVNKIYIINFCLYFTFLVSKLKLLIVIHLHMFKIIILVSRDYKVYQKKVR